MSAVSGLSSTPVPSGKRVPQIAIIGMEGSGKTVLATTLAKRLSTIDARGVFLNPQGVKTLKYVEGVWHTLQSGDWPPSTPPGELFELKWKFQVVGELECDVRLIDAAGQDLRLLFGDEQILSVESLPGNLQVLAEYCRAADIILFLINLKDFVGQGNPEQRTANEAAIKSAMDYLGGDGRPRRVCLVLTQTDLYRDLARERGGWLELAAEAVPYVFGAHIRVHQVAVHPVSAVADTQVVVEQNGTPRRVPKAGFRSEGLDEVVTWLTTQVRDVKRELDQEAEAAALVAQQTSEPPIVQQPPPPPPKESPLGGIIGTIIAIVVVLFLLRGCIPGCSGGGDAGPKSPVGTIVNGKYRDDPGLVDDGVKVFGTVRNDGAAGKIRVIARVTENGVEVEVQSQDFYLGPGQTADYFFQMDKIYSVQNKHEVFTWAVVP